MKLFSTIILLAATADARRRKNKTTEVEESSGEGSGVAPVTATEAVDLVDDLVEDILTSAASKGESTKALSRRVDLLKNRKSKFFPNKILIKNSSRCSNSSRRRLLDSLRRRQVRR